MHQHALSSCEGALVVVLHMYIHMYAHITQTHTTTDTASAHTYFNHPLPPPPSSPSLLLALLDDLDKELNNYNMRCREWYGWHFPELGKLVSDNLVYAKTVRAIGRRECIAEVDLSAVLPEEVEQEVREQAEISMGAEVSGSHDDLVIRCRHGDRVSPCC